MRFLLVPSKGVSLARFRVIALALGLLAASRTLAAGTPEDDFLKANEAVMDRMMTGMAAKPAGDVDADFVNMMEPHHQGAIEMAELELRYGHDAKLQRIAQEIIVDQQQEITAMRLALRRPLPLSTPAPTQAGGQSTVPMMGITVAPPGTPSTGPRARN